MNEIQATLTIGRLSFDVSDITEGSPGQNPTMVVHGTSAPESMPGAAVLIPPNVSVRFHRVEMLQDEQSQGRVLTLVELSVISPAP